MENAMRLFVALGVNILVIVALVWYGMKKNKENYRKRLIIANIRSGGDGTKICL